MTLCWVPYTPNRNKIHLYTFDFDLVFVRFEDPLGYDLDCCHDGEVAPFAMFSFASAIVQSDSSRNNMVMGVDCTLSVHQ